MSKETTRCFLNGLTREELRSIAKSCDIKSGRNKSDTIDNLIKDMSWRENFYVFIRRKPG